MKLTLKLHDWMRFLLWTTAIAFLPATVASAADLVIGDTPGEVFSIDAQTSFSHTGDIYVVGTGSLRVNGTLNLTGTLFVGGFGNATVDGGQLHLMGDYTNIVGYQNGRIIFRNDALLHYVQTYVGQHNIICGENAQVEMSNSRVSADGSSESIIMGGNSSYHAVNMICPDWKTWYLSGQTSLTLENVNIGGDIVFYDSPTMRFVDTVGIMPWLFFDNGAVVDYQFPGGFPSNPTVPVTITFDDSLAGVEGIPWSITMENCTYVAWGINPYPGSQVTVRDSELAMVLFRFVGVDQTRLTGIMQNDAYYSDLTVPVADRHLRLMNTSVTWWKVDVIEGHELTADSIIFSEMMVKDDSRALLTNSICEGQTIHLGAVHDAFVDFRDGEVWSYVSVWDDATMVLRNSVVDFRKGEYRYQTRNIAHNNARLYCLNTTFGYEADPAESEPEAADSALAMVLNLDGPAAVRLGQTTEIRGSAWVKTGPQSPVVFDSYVLEVSPDGRSQWETLRRSTSPVREGTLGMWQTAGLPGGRYRLRLTLYVDGDTGAYPTDEYPAESVVELSTTGGGGGGGGGTCFISSLF
ncbi:MAG: hypothetical protein JRF38_12125 [Deltaproteobacteria bacterium]|jgi:hypothetical protein|nr:hypothetical protein [Deltaproteobacteria bacterium]